MRIKKRITANIFILLTFLLVVAIAGCGGNGGNGGNGGSGGSGGGWSEDGGGYVFYSDEYQTETEDIIHETEDYFETENYTETEDYIETEDVFYDSEEETETEDIFFFDSEEESKADETDSSSVKRVPDYENTNPYRVLVTDVDNIPDSAEMRCSIGSDSFTVDGFYEDGCVVFEVESGAPEEEVVVEQIDIDGYTLSTNVYVDSDVRAYEFKFDELNNDNEDIQGDFIVIVTGVDKKPTSAELGYSKTSLSMTKKISGGIYNVQDRTYKFVITDDELGDVAYLNSVELFGRSLNFNQGVYGPQQIYRGIPKEIRCNYLDPLVKFAIEVTDSSSMLPGNLNFANVEKEIVYTTSDGVTTTDIWKDTMKDDVKRRSAFSETTNDKLKFSIGLNNESVIQINKIRIGNRLYTHGLNIENFQTLKLDLSSDFEKVAIPYAPVVANVPSDLDNILIFKTDDNKEYSVVGEYDSDKREMVYNFKSPADKLDITYIKIGSRKSTAKLDFLNPGNLSPQNTTLNLYSPSYGYDQKYTLLSYETMMGPNGNVWTSAGCSGCGGSGCEYNHNLVKGNGCRSCGYQGVLVCLIGLY